MNERIKELAHECFVITDDGRFDCANEYMVQRFANMIVQECLLSLEPDLYSKEIDYEFEQRFYRRCRGKIVKHFGVEE